MKKLSLFTLLALCFTFFTSCTDDEGGVPAPFDIKTEVKDIEIPFATIEGVEIPALPPINLNLDMDQVIKDNVGLGMSLDNVKKAELVEFTVTLQDSDFVGNLTAIKDMDIYIKAENPTVQEIKVAEVRDNTNPNKIEFEIVYNDNMLEYFESEDIYLVLKNIVPGDSSLTTFTITATPKWRASFGL